MGERMHLVFSLEDVILKPEDEILWKHCHPLTNVVEFMQWLKRDEHHITIWTGRPNTLESKFVTEQWLELQQVPYDRLLFDRPSSAIFVDEAPPNAKYHKNIGDNNLIALLFEEWKEWKKEPQQE
tara:strand:- start:961 stop:1335 length:375 start_codon:yes stop_codon:yes gene_type:complete